MGNTKGKRRDAYAIRTKNERVGGTRERTNLNICCVTQRLPLLCPNANGLHLLLESQKYYLLI